MINTTFNFLYFNVKRNVRAKKLCQTKTGICGDFLFGKFEQKYLAKNVQQPMNLFLFYQCRSLGGI